MWATLCGVLVLACSLTLLAQHRLVVERERSWASQWSRVQAQAMGHGGMMWALARLEDERSIDDACRPAANGDTGPTFAARVQQGARVRCLAGLEPSPAGDATEVASTWTCRCAASSGGTPHQTVAEQGIEVVMDFTPQASELLLEVSVMFGPFDQPSGSWREQVLLRQDVRRVWRAVVGTWWDDRR